MSCKARAVNKFISLLGVTFGGAASFAGFCIYRGDERFYSTLLMPLLIKANLDPEIAHASCLYLTRYKLIKCKDELRDDQAARLRTRVFGLDFLNPIGLAAGFDKDSFAVAGLPLYGLGFAEIGTVTPKPQSGNPKKRIFRVVEQNALINRCGFNNLGLDFVYKRLADLEKVESMLVGLNLGKNKESIDDLQDYYLGLQRASSLNSVDYLVINLSSPNTPGLRQSQNKDNLEKLVDSLLRKAVELNIQKPLLIKIAPDLEKSQIKDIAAVITKKHHKGRKIDGVILTNTTTFQPSSDTEGAQTILAEAGGLSGQPLRDMSTAVIREFYKITDGKVPIIGVGGISSGQDAFDKIKAGASLVQVYTSITYEGPPIINKIKLELAKILESNKITSVTDAVGLDHRK